VLTLIFCFAVVAAVLLPRAFDPREQRGLPPPGLAAPAGTRLGAAPGARATTREEPIVGWAIPDVSPPLRDLVPRRETAPAVPDDVEPARPLLASRGEPDPVVQTGFGGSSMPAPSQNFAGIDNVAGVLPPDPTGDVGPHHYVEMVNLQLAVYSKNGTALLGPIPINTMWQGFEGPCEQKSRGDPIVLYDQLADRWLVSQFHLPSPYGECIAVSASPDPTGSYHRYFFPLSTTVQYDYPKLGVWPDAYYASFNRFASGTFLGGAAIAFDRAKMLAGQTASFQEFDTTADHGGLLPADLEGPTLPPAGRQALFLELFDVNQLEAFRFEVDWNTPRNSTFSSVGRVTISGFTPLCPGTRQCIDQPSTPVKLDDFGDLLMNRLTYRNLGDHEMLLASHSVDADPSSAVHAAVRWYELRNLGSNPPALFQAGTYAPDAAHRWMGSAAMDQEGNIAIGYSVSSTTIFPSIRYTGRLVADPPGTLPQGETTLIDGGGSQTDPSSRWGDYTTMTVDPVDDCTFWYVNEWLQMTSAHSWRTRIGAFRFPACGGPTVASVTHFRVRRVNRALVVTWRTSAETRIAGFEVFRSVGRGPFRRLNRSLIPATAAHRGHGASYTFVDRKARHRTVHTFRLRIVGLEGRRSWHGVGVAVSPTESR
jgi:hypothetical protein